MKKEIEKTKQFKLSFFKRLKMSIVNFEEYHFIAADGAKRAIGYFLLIMVFFSIALSIGLNIKFEQRANEAIEYTKSDLPNFEIVDNKFKIDSENPIILEKDNYKVIIDNDPNYEKYSEDLNNYDGTVLLFNQNNIIAKFDYTSSIAFNYNSFTNYISEENTINKESFLNFVTNNRIKINLIIYGYMLLEIFLIFTLSTLIDILALSLIGTITAKIAGIPLKFGALFSMAVSASTLSIIINLIYLNLKIFTNFNIPQFQVLYTLISYIYLVTAIFIMRSNILKGKLDFETKNNDAEES